MQITNLLILLTIINLGCGLYDSSDLDYISSSDDGSINYYDICGNKCQNVCANCYNHSYSIYMCKQDCKSGCMSKACYLNSYSSICTNLFQELCNGQYDN